MEPLKGICHNKIYTITGYTIEQINCDDNGAYEECEKILFSRNKRKYVKSICRTLRRGQVHP